MFNNCSFSCCLIIPPKTNEDVTEFYDTIKYNMENAWTFANSDEKNFNYMLWRLRHSEDCFRVPILIQYLKKTFRNCNPLNESLQVEAAKMMSYFLNINEVSSDFEYKLSEYDKLDNIFEVLESIALDIPENIDGRVYLSIQKNKLFECDDKLEFNNIREQLMSFAYKVRIVQHYFFHCNEISITRLLGKLLTRLLWIYLTSSPVMN